jgi:hypothetical protein
MSYYDQQPPPYPGAGGQPPPPGWNPSPNTAYPPPGGQGYAGYPPPQQAYAPPPAGTYPPQGGYQQPGPPPVPPPVVGGYGAGGGGTYDPEFGKTEYGGAMAFNDKSIRRGFIRKVFAIITLQLSVVAGMIALFLFQKDCNDFVKAHPWVYYVSYAVFIVTYIALVCCKSVRRSFPANIICLALLTFAIGYMTAMISSFYSNEIVFLSMLICAGCCAAIIIFASQTKYDFTKWMGVMFVVGIVIMLFGFIAVFVYMFTQIYVVYVVYAGLAALLFMVYLAIDIQMLMGGKKYEMSPEDYIFAAVQIFLDIIYIFWFILQIAGFASGD